MSLTINNSVTFTSNNKYEYCNNGSLGSRIKSVWFEQPINFDKAISEIVSDKNIMEDLALYKYFLRKTLSRIQKDLSINKALQTKKIKGLVNYGQTAFVFETERGDIHCKESLQCLNFQAILKIK